MRSRIFEIKKINILRFVAIINFLLFLSSIFLSVFYFNMPQLWFCFFCQFVGFYLITKSFLYKSDALTFLGSLLLSLGIFLFFNFYFHNIDLFYAIVFPFAISSFVTSIFFKQIFQLFLFLIFAFVLIGYFLYRQNIFNIYIFFMIIFIIIFIFFLIYAKIQIRK